MPIYPEEKSHSVPLLYTIIFPAEYGPKALGSLSEPTEETIGGGGPWCFLNPIDLSAFLKPIAKQMAAAPPIRPDTTCYLFTFSISLIGFYFI